MHVFRLFLPNAPVSFAWVFWKPETSVLDRLKDDPRRSKPPQHTSSRLILRQQRRWYILRHSWSSLKWTQIRIHQRHLQCWPVSGKDGSWSDVPGYPSVPKSTGFRAQFLNGRFSKSLHFWFALLIMVALWQRSCQFLSWRPSVEIFIAFFSCLKKEASFSQQGEKSPESASEPQQPATS